MFYCFLKTFLIISFANLHKNQNNLYICINIFSNMETKQTETDITQAQMDAVREAMLNPYRFMERAAASKNKRLYNFS